MARLHCGLVNLEAFQCGWPEGSGVAGDSALRGIEGCACLEQVEVCWGAGVLMVRLRCGMVGPGKGRVEWVGAIDRWFVVEAKC